MRIDDPREERIAKLAEKYQSAVDRSDADDAANAVHEVFSLVAEFGKESLPPELALKNAAAAWEESADWTAAESAYVEILSLPNLEAHTELQAHLDLTKLCRLLQRDARALQHAYRATAAGRRTDVPVLLSIALECEAACLIRCDRIAEASTVLEEALSVVGTDKMLSPRRAHVLTMRAECALCNRQFEQAVRDLDDAWQLATPLASLEVAAGVHSVLTKWWTVTARLRSLLGDHTSSVEAWYEAVSVGNHVASLGHVDNVHTKSTVAHCLKELADELLTCGRSDEATVAMDERKEILCRLSLPAGGE